MEGFLYVSVVFEVAIILACLIFIVLLVSTNLLPKKINRNGVMLFLNLLFISGFYLLINIQWFTLAKPLIWLFVPASISLSLFFYRFNTIWMNLQVTIDKYISFIPLLILFIAVTLEIFNYSVSNNETIRSLRITFTEGTLKLIFPIYSGLLIALNFYKIRIAENLNKESYSEHHLVNLNWSRISLAFFFIFYIGMIFSELSGPFVSELVFNISILTLTLYLGYFQIKVIARYLKTANQNIDNQSRRPVHNIKSESDLNKISSLFKQLDELVSEEQLFLKPDLTIQELSLRLDLNSKYLSQAINHQNDLNFNKYINLKRIEFAQELILNKQYEKYSLEGIAQESGFRSKSTFNTTFKSFTGVTPSEYRKKNNNIAL